MATKGKPKVDSEDRSMRIQALVFAIDAERSLKVPKLTIIDRARLYYRFLTDQEDEQ